MGVEEFADARHEVDETGYVESMKNYLSNPYLVIEVLSCIIFASISGMIPSFIFRMNVYEREIPYIQTANGDIILDQSINRPLIDHETIPDWLLLFLGPFFTSVMILIIAFSFGPKGDTHAGLCALYVAVGFSEFFTNFIKLYVGYFRPNFFNYCEFSLDDLQCESQDSSALIDSRKSFPSGHSSLSFSCMTILTLFFFGKIGLYRLKTVCVGVNDITIGEIEKTVALSYLKKRILSIIATTPISLAIFIAVSRVRDDMHHPADVAFGSIIGFVSAKFGYGLWYNDISGPFSGIPLQTSAVKMRFGSNRNNRSNPIV